MVLFDVIMRKLTTTSISISSILKVWIWILVCTNVSCRTSVWHQVQRSQLRKVLISLRFWAVVHMNIITDFFNSSQPELYESNGFLGCSAAEKLIVYIHTFQLWWIVASLELQPHPLILILVVSKMTLTRTAMRTPNWTVT